MCILALVTITLLMVMTVWDPTDFDDDVSVGLTVLLNPMMQIRDILENALDQSLVLPPSICVSILIVQH